MTSGQDRTVRERIDLTELPASVAPNLFPYGELLIDRGVRAGVHVGLDLKKSVISGIASKEPERTIVRRHNRKSQ